MVGSGVPEEGHADINEDDDVDEEVDVDVDRGGDGAATGDGGGECERADGGADGDGTCDMGGHHNANGMGIDKTDVGGNCQPATPEGDVEMVNHKTGEVCKMPISDINVIELGDYVDHRILAKRSNSRNAANNSRTKYQSVIRVSGGKFKVVVCKVRVCTCDNAKLAAKARVVYHRWIGDPILKKQVGMGDVELDVNDADGKAVGVDGADVGAVGDGIVDGYGGIDLASGVVELIHHATSKVLKVPITTIAAVDLNCYVSHRINPKNTSSMRGRDPKSMPHNTNFQSVVAFGAKFKAMVNGTVICVCGTAELCAKARVVYHEWIGQPIPTKSHANCIDGDAGIVGGSVADAGDEGIAEERDVDARCHDGNVVLDDRGTCDFDNDEDGQGDANHGDEHGNGLVGNVGDDVRRMYTNEKNTSDEVVPKTNRDGMLPESRYKFVVAASSNPVASGGHDAGRGVGVALHLPQNEAPATGQCTHTTPTPRCDTAPALDDVGMLSGSARSPLTPCVSANKARTSPTSAHISPRSPSTLTPQHRRHDRLRGRQTPSSSMRGSSNTGITPITAVFVAPHPNVINSGRVMASLTHDVSQLPIST